MSRIAHLSAATFSLLPLAALAQDSSVKATISMLPNTAGELTPYIRLMIVLTLLSLVPIMLIAMTCFTRIVITMSFIRHALGMPETPPNVVLVTISIILTMFIMAPVLEKAHEQGVRPFMDGKANLEQSVERTVTPFKEFMLAHVRNEDMELIADLARLPADAQPSDGGLKVLIPAFMLSELRAAFIGGFLIFLPFLLIDLVVAVLLMSLGMMMVPPVSISLPLKVLLFIMIDGWGLIIRSLAGAYQ